MGIVVKQNHSEATKKMNTKNIEKTTLKLDTAYQTIIIETPEATIKLFLAGGCLRIGAESKIDDITMKKELADKVSFD